MDRGVILIAAGHPVYTHYAHSLAMSIRYHSDIPIILYYQGGGLNYLFDDQKKLFTEIIEIPIEYYSINGKSEFIKVKTHLYDLSPFEETIFLDADMIFSPFKKIEDLFNENADQQIQFACRGERKMHEGTKSEWVNLSEIKERFGFDHWYELSSEVIYFKKGAVSEEVFDVASYYYSNHGMDRKRWVLNRTTAQWEVEKKHGILEFAGGIPDEVPFALALEQTKVKIKAPYAPSYWQPAYVMKITPDVDVKNNYYLISIGGASLQTNTRRIYDTLCKFYSEKTLKKRPPYKAIEKRRLIPERKKI